LTGLSRHRDAAVAWRATVDDPGVDAVAFASASFPAEAKRAAKLR
jgi:hypothetical protein